jgi:hypothetical protein
MDRKTAISDHFIHVGSGTGLVLAYLGLIPGFIPALALTILIGAVLVVPVVIVGLAVAIAAAPFYLASRVVRRARRHRRHADQPSRVQPMPVPAPHTV